MEWVLRINIIGPFIAAALLFPQTREADKVSLLKKKGIVFALLLNGGVRE